jgi:filamentous hemagglutinin family protein
LLTGFCIMKGDRILLGILVELGAIGLAMPAVAQSVIVPDGTLGNERSVVVENYIGRSIEAIGGGARRVQNLFHSFSQFNVSEGRSAYFFIPDNGVRNVLTRVTGSSASEIMGRLGTFQIVNDQFAVSNTNFFLVNPNGVIFGPSSSLDIGGSVVVTTANALQFPNGELFSATVPTIPSSVLTVDPSALLYNAINAQNKGIVVRSAVNDPNNLIGTTTGLQVRNRKSFILAGGDIRLENGVLRSPSGSLQLGGLSESGEINLIIREDKIDSLYPLNLKRSDIQVLNDSSINVTSIDDSGGGNILIYAENVVFEKSKLSSGIDTEKISRDSQSGNIEVYANEDIFLNTSSISNIIRANDNDGSPESSSGNILIKASNINIDASGIGTSIDVGSGDSGTISIFASENLTINDSGIASSIGMLTASNVGSLFLKAKNLIVSASNFAAASSSYSGDGKGNAGNIDIIADESVFFTRGPVSLYRNEDGKIIESYDDSSLRTSIGFGSAGKGGNITIKARSIKLEYTNIDSSTRTGGSAGNILLESKENVDIKRAVIDSSNSNGQYIGGLAGNTVIKSDYINISDKTEILSGNIGKDDKVSTSGGTISVEASKYLIIDFSRVQSEARASGSLNEDKAGKIFISSPIVSITNSSEINTKTETNSRAGDIIIDAGNLFILNSSIVGSFVERETENATGGTINITANNLEFRNGGKVTSSVLGSISFPSGYLGYIRTLSGSQGDSGSIQINTKDSIIISGVSQTNRTLRDNEEDSLSPIGSASGIFTIVEQGSVGNAGKITVRGSNLSIIDGGQIASQNLGIGNSDSIDLQLHNRFEVFNGSLLASSFQGSGGNITVFSNTIYLEGNGDIKTNATQNGGNITLTARSIVALNDSDILAFARDGKGGNVTLNTRAFFGQNYRPAPFGTNPATLDGNDRVDINASGTVSGIITTPDTSFIQNSLNQLPKDMIDTTKLLANTCIVRKDKPEGTFYITGTGGLPNRPGDLSPSQYPTNTITPTQTANRPWQKGDPIEEPQGFYQLTNGRLVMSRECQT